MSKPKKSTEKPPAKKAVPGPYTWKDTTSYSAPGTPGARGTKRPMTWSLGRKPSDPRSWETSPITVKLSRERDGFSAELRVATHYVFAKEIEDPSEGALVCLRALRDDLAAKLRDLDVLVEHPRKFPKPGEY